MSALALGFVGLAAAGDRGPQLVYAVVLLTLQFFVPQTLPVAGPAPRACMLESDQGPDLKKLPSQHLLLLVTVILCQVAYSKQNINSFE